ncbi:hypothetical protein ABIB25_005038 [Nakamurella sp. UYEF19]|uniref:DUF6474 family protein n=1 Tax=Nakamurella sp. UYEF19 TaxID=1756392 RepID=UPI0033950866
MFGRKSSSYKRAARAEKKAAKKAQKASKKVSSKAGKVSAKADRAGKKADKLAKKEPAGFIGTLTNPKTAKRALAVAKIAGPSISPLALKAATSTRGFLDDRRALKLGVTADEVAAYRGPTGPAGARIASLRTAIDDLRRRRTADLQVVRFSDVAKARLADLNTAVQTAASMPAARRRGTLSAVGKELNQIESDLMTYLVGTPV